MKSDLSGKILPGSLAFHFATHARLNAAYTEIALIFHRAGLDIWHRPDGSAHPARFSFGRRAVVPAHPDDAPHAAAWINVREHRLVINGGMPAETGMIAIRGHFPPEEFPRQPDSQNIKIAIEPGIPPEIVEALNQRLARALAAIPPDSYFAPRPGQGGYWPEAYVQKA
jgi:hypothetical protein